MSAPHSSSTRICRAASTISSSSSAAPLADRFILHVEPVARADLAQIWRQIGDPAWNAPVYEQFYRSVRAVNRMQPPKRRIRVLLGQAPITTSQVIAHAGNRAVIAAIDRPMGAHFAALIEREVLANRHGGQIRA